MSCIFQSHRRVNWRRRWVFNQPLLYLPGPCTCLGCWKCPAGRWQIDYVLLTAVCGVVERGRSLSPWWVERVCPSGGGVFGCCLACWGTTGTLLSSSLGCRSGERIGRLGSINEVHPVLLFYQGLQFQGQNGSKTSAQLKQLFYFVKQVAASNSVED